MQVKMTDVIAVRNFWWEGEPEHPLLVAIGKPAQTQDNQGEFYCPIQITGLDDDGFVQPIFGVDAFQAIDLAMRYVAYRIFEINAKSGGRLRWEFGDDSRIPDDWEQRTERQAE